MNLQGQEGQLYLDQYAAFYYQVNSCQSMNLIRQTLGIDNVTCVEYDDMIAVATNFTVDVKVVNAFFDAKRYS